MHAKILLAAFIVCFTLYFSWYSIQRYQTLNAYTADLSLIDQAMWNTLQGRFLEATWGAQQQPRLAEHFEPILVPLATIFWLWDDVRALLILQALALALGALPIYWLARARLNAQSLSRPTLHLAFPLIYLLSPPLQAAAVADFHADPLMVAPWLFLFWYTIQRRWGWMWLWAIVVMMTKETMPTLVVMMGGYLVVTTWPRRADQNLGASTAHGLGLIIVGALWFLIATFGIVAPLAQTYFGSDGPIYLTSRFVSSPLTWPLLLQDPNRQQYLINLLATTGGLALFAPAYLLLGLPLLAANTISNFAGQYSGEQHYSAPLVAILMVSAIYGTANLDSGLRWLLPTKQTIARVLFYSLFILACLGAFIFHTRYGWTPLSRRTVAFTPSAHTETLPTLLAQIPPTVPVSASAAVHPHLAHRPVAYTFPTVQDAQYLLVDVTDVPGIHPNDVRTQLSRYLASEDWRLLDAVQGFMLLKSEARPSPPTLPDQFYAFAKAADSARPQNTVSITFDDAIQLLGFDIIDEPFERQTAIRLYWQALQPHLPPSLTLWPQLFDDTGQPLTDPHLQPAIATVWYPPTNWRPGEVIVTETLSQQLGERFHLAVSVIHGHTFAEISQRLPIQGEGHLYDQRTWAHIASFERGDWALSTIPPQPIFQSLTPTKTQFDGEINLISSHFPARIQAQQPLILYLQWMAHQPLPLDYTVFLHLIDETETIVGQNDAQPFWLTPLPMTRWTPDQIIPDVHQIAPPLPPGRYQLRLGLYDWQTQQRLPLLTGADALILGEITIAAE